MATDFDVIVIGSGFGGAVVSCRLAEAGYKVVVLERGRRWETKDYPREARDPWIWDQSRPEISNGWIDLRVFPNMSVVQGAGVGGGSLIYANIQVEAKRDLFQQGWPPEITYDELKPHYETVGAMLKIQKVPDNQWPKRTQLVKEAAERAGFADRFQPLELAVSFDPEWNYGLPDPFSVSHSKIFTNEEGVAQGTCVHLGNCVIGCDVKAKNTLDLNYLARAERHGTEIRPLHLVRNISPEAGGYRVRFDRIEGGARQAGAMSSRIVVVAAGSLGSTELLLRCRDEHRTLPQLSSFLGKNWSANGDFLTPTFYIGRDILPTRGPTITSSIDFLGERNLDGDHFFIEDGGFPDVLRAYLEMRTRESPAGMSTRFLIETLRHVLRQPDPFRFTMPWFGMGRDAADGQLTLRRQFLFFGRRRLHLKWDIGQSERTINAIVEMHRSLAQKTGGSPFVPLTWTLGKQLITPHPLGGCNLGTTPANGVVDHKGEVFGYTNLFVADGAIIPEAIGANPSKTISALAERIARIIREEGR